MKVTSKTEIAAIKAFLAKARLHAVTLFLKAEQDDFTHAFGLSMDIMEDWSNAWLTILPQEVGLLQELDPRGSLIIEQSAVGPYHKDLTLNARVLQFIRSRLCFNKYGA